MSKMTRRLLAIVMVAVVVVAIGAVLLARFAFAASGPRSDWKTFHDPLEYYTLQYPKGWGPQGGIASQNPSIEGFHFNPMPTVANVPYVYIESFQLPTSLRSVFCGLSANGNSVKGSRMIGGYVAIPYADPDSWQLASKTAWFQFEISLPSNVSTHTLAADKADIGGILASFRATGGHLTC
jgi:hypothetical protein